MTQAGTATPGSRPGQHGGAAGTESFPSLPSPPERAAMGEEKPAGKAPLRTDRQTDRRTDRRTDTPAAPGRGSCSVSAPLLPAPRLSRELRSR